MDLLLLQTETFHSIGGMQMYNRALCRAASDLVAERGGSLRVLCLNDRTEDLDSRYLSSDCFSGFGDDRRAFIVAALSAATARPSGAQAPRRPAPETVRYWVAGDGSDRPRLEALARERGVPDLVDFLGRIPDEELQRRYAACDLFALSSVAGVTRAG
ncbi:MAG: glycosyltransferase [Myxococcales bacterium]